MLWVWMSLWWPLAATAVPRETPSATPIPPDIPTKRHRNTVAPTITATLTNTPMPPSPTPTYNPTSPPPADGITLTRREGAETVFVLAGPDVSNVQLGTLAVNETAEVIGRTGQNEWLQIMTDRGVQGWVANCEVTLSSSNLSSVAITWTDSVTPKNCDDTDSFWETGTTVSPVGSCVNVSLSHTDWPGPEFDDVLLSWSMFRLQLRGSSCGLAVPPTMGYLPT